LTVRAQPERAGLRIAAGAGVIPGLRPVGKETWSDTGAEKSLRRLLFLFENRFDVPGGVQDPDHVDPSRDQGQRISKLL
jgi:hypothetical protein